MAVKLDILLNIISKSAIQKMGRELDASLKQLGKKFSFDDFFGGSKGVSALEKNFAKAERSMDRITRATERLTLRWMRSGTLEKMAKMFGYDIYGEEGMNELARFKQDFAEKWFLKRERDKAENRSKTAKDAAKAKKQKEEDIKNIEKTKKKTWQEIFMGSVKGLTSRNPIFDQMKKFYMQQDKDAKARQREQNKQQKDFWNKMFLRWGKLGVWGLITQQAIKYISKAVGFAYSTSMQGLDWQRTISGGASGGSWFGQGLAAYQRAGIGANQYQGFKRGVQGYLGQVKLGMGNAAPLMYLGLSALGNPDELERELERGLRKLPKDVSLALAGQMGLDYNMWEAIYSGRLDRQRSAYSEEAIQQWSELAKGLNELITNINTFFFNYLAPIASSIGEFLQRLSEGKTGIGQSLDIGSGYVSRLVKVALSPIEVIFKNEKGEVIGKGEAQPDYSGDIIELGSGVK